MEPTVDTKYYTPSLEEFHIGFEYEYLVMREGSYWGGAVLEESDFIPHDNGDFNECFPFNRKLEDFRVKYLDKEDIESLGFKPSEEYSNTYTITHKCILHLLENYKIEIYRGDQIIYHDTEYLYQGTCKNKSKLKSILKDVGVL